MAASSTNPQPSSTHQQHPFPPMYKSLAKVNVGNFVTVKLSGDTNSNNYSFWKLQVLSLIESHDLLHFIDGSTQPPQKPQAGATTASGDYNLWRTDKVLRGWILGTIAEHRLLETVFELATAGEVWLALKRRFQEKVNESIVIGQDLFNIQMLLLKHATRGDWDAAQQILNNDLDKAMIWIHDLDKLTSSEPANGERNAIDFVENLLGRIPVDELARKTDLGSTALHIAAAVGNTAVAVILVGKMQKLCYIPDDSGDFPIQCAAKYAKKDTLQYLMSVTRDDEITNPYADLAGLQLLTYAIDANFFDIALDLVKKHPDLAGVKFPNGDSALGHLIGSGSSFPRGEGPMETRLLVPPAKDASELRLVARGFRLLKVIGKWMDDDSEKMARRKGKMKEKALELVILLCDTLKSMDDFHKARDIYENAIFKAAKLGVRVAVEVILNKFPLSIFACQMPSRRYIFHEAVENRSEDVFTLIYLMNQKHSFSNFTDTEGNNLLHLAAKLGPTHKLNKIRGPALQMEYELQWFQEVKTLLHPSAREQKNISGKTPRIVFMEEHKNLKEAGEKWLKDTASAGTITATLIITVMFAAAITVPGGNNNDTGLPMFSRKATFTVFAVGDAISLFCATTSLMEFLGILTSRYSEKDFLITLRRRLTLSFYALVLSLYSILVSFSAALYLVFGQERLWVLILVIVLAAFTLLQLFRFDEFITEHYISKSFYLKIRWHKSFGNKSNELAYMSQSSIPYRNA